MPTVKDKVTGDVVSRQPYTSEGTKRAQEIVGANPDWEIDYAPGGTENAPDMRESYQLGGQIPGQPGFGQRPQPINPGMNPLGDTTQEVPNPLPRLWEKGGKVKKKY